MFGLVQNADTVSSGKNGEVTRISEHIEFYRL